MLRRGDMAPGPEKSYNPGMAPKPKTPPTLSRERLLELMDPETVDELERAARGEPVETVDGEAYVRWLETGEGEPPCDSSD